MEKRFDYKVLRLMKPFLPEEVTVDSAIIDIHAHVQELAEKDESIQEFDIPLFSLYMMRYLTEDHIELWDRYENPEPFKIVYDYLKGRVLRDIVPHELTEYEMKQLRPKFLSLWSNRYSDTIDCEPVKSEHSDAGEYDTIFLFPEIKGVNFGVELNHSSGFYIFFGWGIEDETTADQFLSEMADMASEFTSREILVDIY